MLARVSHSCSPMAVQQVCRIRQRIRHTPIFVQLKATNTNKLPVLRARSKFWSESIFRFRFVYCAFPRKPNIPNTATGDQRALLVHVPSTEYWYSHVVFANYYYNYFLAILPLMFFWFIKLFKKIN